MQTSSTLLEGLPTFENAKEQQNQFREKLEGMVKPVLVKALESRDRGEDFRFSTWYSYPDVEQALNYSNILKQIQSNISLTDLYFASRLPPLLALWDQLPFDKRTMAGSVLGTINPFFIAAKLFSRKSSGGFVTKVL